MMFKSNKNANLPQKSNTCAIVTLFYPGPEILDHLDKIKPQVHHIILIINSCNQPILTALSEKYAKPGQHSVITNQQNMGLAYALNQGLEIAYSLKMEWLLLLDQDTAVDTEIIANLSGIVATIPSLSFILGSNYRSHHDMTVAIRSKGTTVTYQKKSTVITSGTLLNLSDTHHIGHFKSEYFIDSIDHEYCMRARSLGYEIYITDKPFMSHDIGIQDQTFLNKLKCLLSHPHKPERKYYTARNTVVTANKYFYIFPFWSMRQYARILADIFSTLIFERHKLQIFKFILRGVIDGLQSNFKPGPLETDHSKP